MFHLLALSLSSFFLISSAPIESACEDASPAATAHFFDPIDQIVSDAIREHQFPGCQVLVMQHGQVLLDRSYGYLTYDSLMQVHGNTMYDLASVTKVAATTIMFMDLFEKGFIHLDDPVSCYLPEYLGTDKEKMTIRELLSHNSGLRSFLPLWEKTIGGDFLDPESDEPPIIDTYGHVMGDIVMDTLKNLILKSQMAGFRGKSRYRYSDLGFMILHQIAENASGQTLEDYMSEQFYQPLALRHLMFNPTKKGIPFTQIAPTEFDRVFRQRQVWGDVHDRNAALFGGVAGHAGLFSNSKDLGKLLTMILNDGTLDDHHYLSEQTIETFNHSYFAYNRRALGWDKPNSKVSSRVSASSFGHSGFTGTMVWADPEKDMVFVFLSNRVYPNAENRKLITSNTRSRIQDVVYDALASIEKGRLQDVK
jgi:CubicO group peptidase (beta-lactamase class C family)